MKKEWIAAQIDTVDVRETAFGLYSPDNSDSEKTQVEINGVKGWQELFGAPNSSI